jgi:Phytanoyl-CoA dioxygenase (PhyH)
MSLTPPQLQQFAEEGWLFLPGCFSEEEVAILRDEAESIYATNRQEVWREKTGAPRTAFAAHTYNEAFRLLGHHPRLIGPVEQVFGEPLYMHQYKINAKAAFEGDVWQWHQDYDTWARDDGNRFLARQSQPLPYPSLIGKSLAAALDRGHRQRSAVFALRNAADRVREAGRRGRGATSK